jgi:hypothetical protein
LQGSFHAEGNLTGNYPSGIHILKVVVTDSLGHTFTRSHTFIVASITIQNLGITDTYTVVPFTMNWTLNIPAIYVSNRTFNMSLDIRYIASGCGGRRVCPEVVNYSERLHNGQVDYNQSLNMTLLNLDHFYSGSNQLPPGQYEVIVWLNANHSGSIAAQVNTYLVFDSVNGQINGPTANEVVPLGNVTVSYSYTGDYVTNATLSIFALNQPGPVFTVGAFVPGIGLRGSAAIWPAVQTGT